MVRTSSAISWRSLYLDRNPDAFETVQRLLGHKSRETTMRFYRELDAILAGKRSPRLCYPPASLPSPANQSLHQDHAKPPLGASPGGTIAGVEAIQVQIPATASSLPGLSGLPVPGDGQSASGGSKIWNGGASGKGADRAPRRCRSGVAATYPLAQVVDQRLGIQFHPQTVGARGAHRHAGTPDGTTRNEVGQGISSQLCQLECLRRLPRPASSAASFASRNARSRAVFSLSARR